MQRLVLQSSLLVCALAVLSLPAGAHEPAAGTVTGTASAEVQRRPEFLRVQVEVLACGADLKEALAKLKERKDAARAQLLALGAAKDAIEFGTARLSSTKSPQEQRMGEMLRQQTHSGKKAASRKETPTVIVGAALKVDLPLQGATPEELLLAAETLRTKVQDADLAGMKDLNKMTPQEEEVAEELASMQGRFGGDEGPKRGEPVFVYVAKVTEEERAAAMAEAFQKAKMDALRLARAAGHELGSLSHLTSLVAPASDGDENNKYRYGQGGDNWNGEAAGSQPDKLTVRFTVTAYFTLKPATK